MRKDKTNYYLDIAEATCSRGTCLRRNFGSIIVSNDQIVSTGYTGAPRGRQNCIDCGECFRSKQNIPKGERYELCRSVHAEANAIIHAARQDMIGATLFLVGINKETGDLVEDANSCAMCKRLIINAGIEKVVVRNSRDQYSVYYVQDWIENEEGIVDGY